MSLMNKRDSDNTAKIQPYYAHLLTYFNDMKDSFKLCEKIENAIDPDLSLFAPYGYSQMTIPEITYETVYDEWKTLITCYSNSYKIYADKNFFQIILKLDGFRLENNSILVRSYVNSLWQINVSDNFKSLICTTLNIPTELFNYKNGEELFSSFNIVL